MRNYAAYTCVLVGVGVIVHAPNAVADSSASQQVAQPNATGAQSASAQVAQPGATGSQSASAQVVKRDPEHAPRRRDASWREIFSGPFPSSRLFNMPTAEVVGAYQLSLSGDASLLNESSVLSTSGVVAVGFGDIAQLEYRASSAITTDDETIDKSEIRIPTLGVQLKIPYQPHRYVPELAVALRFGLPRTQTSADGALSHEQRATDLYLMSRLALGRVSLHGGVRISAAAITSEGEGAPEDAEQNLLLPAAGVEVQVTKQTQVAVELAQVPLFAPGDQTRPSEVSGGMFGRGGIRWRVAPWLVMDASVGYRIEVERLEMDVDSMGNALVDWDIRLGGEIFIPWGAVLCRSSGRFCE